MERDGANLFVLEGILISLILLGAAYAVRSLHESSSEDTRPRAELERLATDMLTVLAGLDDGNGTSLLDLYVMEAMHCGVDVQPSATDCYGTRSKNLTLKLDNYLPLGAGYAIGIGNGLGLREIYRSPLPEGESVSASFMANAEWNLTFAVSELSCYDAASDVNITLIPIEHGAYSWTRWGNVTVGRTETAGERAHTPSWWNVTLPAATRSASGTFVANLTGNGTLPGASSYGLCALAGAAGALRDATRATQFTASPTIVPIASATTFTADLGAIAAVPGATIVAANVTVYEPLPPQGEVADTWISAGTVALSGSTTRTGAWTPAESQLYGAHPALLRVGVDVGGVRVELRRVIVVDVALPTSEIPIEPPYRITLQVWLADWG